MVRLNPSLFRAFGLVPHEPLDMTMSKTVYLLVVQTLWPFEVVEWLQKTALLWTKKTSSRKKRKSRTVVVVVAVAALKWVNEQQETGDGEQRSELEVPRFEEDTLERVAEKIASYTDCQQNVLRVFQATF